MTEHKEPVTRTRYVGPNGDDSYSKQVRHYTIPRIETTVPDPSLPYPGDGRTWEWWGTVVEIRTAPQWDSFTEAWAVVIRNPITGGLGFTRVEDLTEVIPCHDGDDYCAECGANDRRAKGEHRWQASTSVDDVLVPLYFRPDPERYVADERKAVTP